MSLCVCIMTIKNSYFISYTQSFSSVAFEYININRSLKESKRSFYNQPDDCKPFN